MTSFGALLLTSFKAIASLFLQYLIGATVAWFGIVKESDLRGFGAAMNYVFVPLLSIVFISSRAGMPKRAMAGLEAFFFLGFTAAIYKSATESLSPENRFDFSNRLQARNSGAILRNSAQLF